MRKLPSSLRKRLLAARDTVVVRQSRYGAFLLEPRDLQDLNMASGRILEYRQFDEVRRLITEIKPDLFLDIGSNFGLYAITAGTMGIDEVHAFEPVMRKYLQICGSIALNRFADRVHAHQLAVGAQAGTGEIHIVPGLSVVSRFRSATEGTDWDFSETQPVRIAAIDDLFDCEGRRVLVKIDVEGGEVEALAGMKRFLGQNQVFLQVESFPDKEGAVRQFMDELHYRITGQIENDFYFAPPHPGAPGGK